MKDYNNKVWTTSTTKNSEIKKINSLLNSLLWFVMIVIISSIVFASIYLTIFKDSSALTAALIILGVVFLLVIAKQTNEGSTCWQFILNARLEMRKVVWPTRQETINSTFIVLVIVVISSIIIYLVGLLFMNIMQAILS